MYFCMSKNGLNTTNMKSGVICQTFICCLKIFLNISSLPDRVIRGSEIIGFLILCRFLGQKLIYNILVENSLADNFRFEFEKSSVLTTDEVESA